MSVYEMILKRRSIRKFKQDKISIEVLEKLVNAARFAPSGGNMQPLKYRIVNKPDEVEGVFNNVKWAFHIAPKGTPGKGEEPVAYIVILVDSEIRPQGYEFDVGAASQNILLTALEEGIGTCWIASVNREKVRALLEIPDKYIIESVIALGYPAESPIVEEENGSTKYYKDECDVLHVPKRKLKDIII
ncbi:MAG TPA: nitroreductase family protein [Clostridiaceae bacterium]|nr:nitroreductase family protein [Clostridiaceae bacterium]